LSLKYEFRTAEYAEPLKCGTADFPHLKWGLFYLICEKKLRRKLKKKIKLPYEIVKNSENI
jgi:hypothetical protein